MNYSDDGGTRRFSARLYAELADLGPAAQNTAEIRARADYLAEEGEGELAEELLDYLQEMGT